jgi:hypothetical protein
MTMSRRQAPGLGLSLLALVAAATPASAQYFPPAGQWALKSPAEAGLDLMIVGRWHGGNPAEFAKRVSAAIR